MKQALDSYLAVRRAAGFQLKKVERLLGSFVQFCSEQEKTHICAQTAIEWASQGSTVAQRVLRIQTVVHFAVYLRAEDPRHEIPPHDFFGSYHCRRRTPFIFQREDINQLVEKALQIGPSNSLKPHMYSTLFALLSVTGMRISEALNLQLEDVTVDGLIIRNTKFGKSRLLPLHPSAAAGLERYLLRRRHVAASVNNVFLSQHGKKLDYATVRYQLQRLVRQLNLHVRAGQPLPRTHDFRHSFATRSLLSSPEGRDMIARHMVALSTYLGHSNIQNTYWYLEATPELLTDIAAASECHFKGGSS